VDPEKTIAVEFQPIGRRGSFKPGAVLLDCARGLGVDIVSLCGGTGNCGKCIVQVINGEVSPIHEDEKKCLEEDKLSQGYRLACRTNVLYNVKVRIPPESFTIPQRTQIEGEDIEIQVDPLVHLYDLTLTAPTLENSQADSERLLAALRVNYGLQDIEMDFAVMRQLPPLARELDWKMRVAVRKNEIIGILPVAHKALGIAVDIGTTKVAVYLMDIETGATLAARGIMNPQIAYGEDLITRLASVSKEASNGELLHRVMSDALNETITEMCAQAGFDQSQIVDSVMVANTAMHHLFLHLPTKQLSGVPFAATVTAPVNLKVREVGINFAPGAYVHMLPNISGYVGADHVSTLLATGMHKSQGVVLAIDIGTNTEICLSNNRKMSSLSCASGPAFEGAHIRHGMRAADGAIEKIRIVDSKVEYLTIGGKDPVGICGSGILDALAHLHRNGIIDKRGKMADHPLIRDNGKGKEFLIVDKSKSNSPGPDITLTQDDVRELQLAKGAIKAGIEVLLKVYKIETDDIDQVIIAGAFGTYIDVESAIEIKMLPNLPLEKFRQVGNAAGMGAKIALMSVEQRREAEAFAKTIGCIGLSSYPRFNMIFSTSMYLN